MRIGMIVSMFPRLSETFILDQITGLLDRGHKLTVIAGIDPREDKVHSRFVEYNLRSLSYWLPKNKVWRYLKACFLLAFRYPNHFGRLRKALDLRSFHRDAITLRLFYCMIPYIREGPFDIVYCHFGENGNVGAFMKEMGERGKLVAVFHGSDLTARVKAEGTKYYDRLFKNADLLLPVSEAFRDRLIQMGAHPQKTAVHRIGIDVLRFQFSPRSYEQGQPLKILTIARFVEKKGLEFSIRAVANLMAKHPERSIIYHIIGHGPLAGGLRNLIRELRVENSILLLGGMEQSSVLDWMMKSHIYVLASVTASNGDQEGIPVSLMEAMATGMPVVSTYHSGIPELITHEVNGFLAPERDVDSLTHVFEQLMLHPEKWPEIGRAARRTVEANHSLENQITELGKIFDSLEENYK
jgi:colanic acid/amylovoran biosynthesis glycosyltransferase